MKMTNKRLELAFLASRRPLESLGRIREPFIFTIEEKKKLTIAITLDSNYRDLPVETWDFRLDFVDRAFDFLLGCACLQVSSDEAVEQSLYEDKEREVELNYKGINEHH
ncbi:hypothetical protein F2Q70_00000972 [Brassica cretica]|uniref:Uncharacterized protein n=1 Tax=Brassica cretica TaxID=69181 RepID=A0A8S9ILY0_BRACR|nr:hypothetical protein F2Q70_00000972 [Brassica cretica]